MGRAQADSDAIATGGQLSADLLARARPGITVVPVGRGTVIDEVPLAAALSADRVGFAALDVFTTELLPTAARCGRCRT